MLYFRQKTAQVCGNFPKINYIGFWSLCQLSVRELPARTPSAGSLFQAGSRGGISAPGFSFFGLPVVCRQVSIVEKRKKCYSYSSI